VEYPSCNHGQTLIQTDGSISKIAPVRSAAVVPAPTLCLSILGLALILDFIIPPALCHITYDRQTLFNIRIQHSALVDYTMPKRDETQKSSAAVSNKAILAAVNSHKDELLKVYTLVDSLKKSLEGRLDSIEARLTTLQREHSEAQHRLDDIDAALSSTDVRVSALEATCSELAAANVLLKAKLNDLEGRSHRQNIRIVGIKEGEEGGRPTEFVSKLISELFGQDNFPRPVKIDRAHRALRPKPPTHERPRIIIARVHNVRDVMNILRLSRQQAPLLYHGQRLSIFPDYTAEVSAQRQAFNTVRKKLVEAGAKCSMRFPAKLLVSLNDTVKTFDSPTDAEQFVNSLSYNG
uniref:L1 transposable element RRM domain-containing protein n=1 Tax=Amphilophus citrinellus TaxID=61819 RepID=A0A3Q0R454_AMPCI